MDSRQFQDALLELSRDLRKALADHDSQVHVYAVSERIYRKNRAKAMLQTTGSSSDKREAEVDLFPLEGDLGIAEGERRSEPETIADLRYRRDLADGMRTATLERVRSVRQEISALQSLMGAYREEAAYDRTGPQDAA